MVAPAVSRTVRAFSTATPLLRLRTHRLQTSTIPRAFSTISAMQSNVTEGQNETRLQPKIAKGQDESKVKAELETLLSGGWQLDPDQIQLKKTYHCKSYPFVKFLTMEIMSRSQIKNHHPVIENDISSVTVRWTTHQPRGLTDKDTFMARYCDQAARTIGTVDASETTTCGSAPTS